METTTVNHQASADDLIKLRNGLGNVGTGITPPNHLKTAEEVEAEKKVAEEANKDKNKDKVEDKVEDKTETETTETTEENEETQESENEDETIFDVVKKKLPFELKDDNGNDIEFGNSFDDVVAFTETVGLKYAQHHINSFLESNPDVKSLVLHLQNGGSVDTFVKQAIPDFSKITLDANNKEQLKNVYVDSLKIRNYNPSDINILLESAEAKGDLFDKAKAGQAELIKFREDSLKKEEQQRQAAIQKEKEEADETLKEVQSVIKKGKLLNAEVSVKDQNDFLVYLTKPVKDGLTQHQIDMENDDMEHELFHAYQRFKKYGGILPKVANKTEQNKTTGLPTRKNPAIVKSNESTPSNNKPPEITASDRDRLLGK